MAHSHRLDLVMDKTSFAENLCREITAGGLTVVDAIEKRLAEWLEDSVLRSLGASVVKAPRAQVHSTYYINRFQNLAHLSRHGYSTWDPEVRFATRKDRAATAAGRAAARNCASRRAARPTGLLTGSGPPRAATTCSPRAGTPPGRNSRAAPRSRRSHVSQTVVCDMEGGGLENIRPAGGHRCRRFRIRLEGLRGRAEAPFAFRPEDVHAQITMRSIPVSRAFRSSADDFLPSLLLAAEGGPAPVFPELLQEPGPRQRSLVAGHLGPERLHQRSGPGGRNAEELLDVAAREEGPVELFELADGVGDGEEPPGLGGHR